MRPRALAFPLLLGVIGVCLLVPSAGIGAATKPRCSTRSVDPACARRPFPSLQPAATQRLWRRLVRRRHVRTFAATPGCRPLRAVFYAQSDWLRLATKLAGNASPCAEYYISIPPLAADKTRFRPDQAWRIRALGPSFHALAEVHMTGWRGWVNSTGSTWYEAGVEARRRMAAAGFDLSLGDDWIVNELSSAVRRGIGSARTEARNLVHGIHDGDGGPATRGGVFDIGVGQGGAGPGAVDLSLYKSQLEAWLQDAPFWTDMSRYVSDWSQELYGDPRNYAVPGAALATRRDHLNDFLQHQLVHVRLGGNSTAAARSFLESTYSPLANAAWQWASGYGWTMVSAEQMEDYVSAQVYSLRHFSALDGATRDHWGFAWAPHNATGLPPTDFATQTGAILDRLAAAIHDSAEPVDPGDPGIGACGPLGQNLWCRSELTGAWLNDGWKTFTYWGRLAVVFTTPPRLLAVGSVSGPITIKTRLRGSAYDTPSALTVGFTSSSLQGRFSTSPSGPWTNMLVVTIPAGGNTAPTVYYTDTLAGRPVLTASALGTDTGTQAETVIPVAPPPPPTNQRPRITSARFGEVRHVPRGRRYVTGWIRTRVCDDSDGRLLARIEQRRKLGGRVRARGVFTRALASTSGRCRTFKLGWRLRNAFLARGRYTVTLRVRDSEGSWSRSVQHTVRRSGP
jgi:hypothetical protein